MPSHEADYWKSYGEAVDWKSHSDAARNLLVRELRRFREGHPDSDFSSWPASTAASEGWRCFEERWKRSSLKKIKRRVVDLFHLAAKYQHPIPVEWAKIAVRLAVREVFQVRTADAKNTFLCERLYEFVDEVAIPLKLRAQTASAPDAFEHTDDYCRIEYRGDTYHLTPSAGKIVRVLHEAYEAGKVGAGSTEIKKRWKCGKVWDQFRRRDGRRFWKALIGKEAKDFFKLKLAPLVDPEHTPSR